MMQAILKHTKAPVGYTSIRNVDVIDSVSLFPSFLVLMLVFVFKDLKNYVGYSIGVSG